MPRRSPTPKAPPFVLAVLLTLPGLTGFAQEAPSKLTSDEPFAADFSWAKGLAAADAAAVAWGSQRSCVTCHTNGLHLVVGALAGSESAAATRTREDARDYLKQFVIDKKKKSGQRGAIEGIVATASFLTISDMKTTGKLDPVTRRALDHIWEKQDESGAWEDWLQCNWPPFEVDEHFGVTLAAVAMGHAPPDYRKTERAKIGLAKLRSYLRKNPPENPHQAAMTLWAAKKLPVLAGPSTRKRWRGQLKSLQRRDGGWRLVDLGGGAWKRSGESADKQPSDAYATGLVTFVLRNAGVSKSDRRLAKGIKWLKRNQRESGRWFTRSPKRDGHHYISNAATNFALLAIAACDAKGP